MAVLSITAASTGLNFTAATECLFAELHWTPGSLAQCEARIRRGRIVAVYHRSSTSYQIH